MIDWKVIVEIVERIPVIGRIYDRFFKQEDPQVVAIKELGRTNGDLMSEALRGSDNPKEIVEALHDYNPRFFIDGDPVEKDFGPRGPFDRLK